MRHTKKKIGNEAPGAFCVSRTQRPRFKVGWAVLSAHLVLTVQRRVRATAWCVVTSCLVRVLIQIDIVRTANVHPSLIPSSGLSPDASKTGEDALGLRRTRDRGAKLAYTSRTRDHTPIQVTVIHAL